jgi:hypothetical protein
MNKFHLWPEEPHIDGDRIMASFCLEMESVERQQLWFRIPLVQRQALTTHCDPFVLAALFRAMRAPADLIVHGQASPSLLRNLEEYQAVWVKWRPKVYSKIEIQAESEIEAPGAKTSAAVLGFSGGVDSSFSAYHHRRGNPGRGRQDVQAAIFVHGFDIALSRKESYERAAKKARAMLDSLGVEMIPMAINLKQLGDDWGDSHAAGLASCLMLLGGRFALGLIASSYPYSYLQSGWGSNPVSDWLLSSDSFTIVHDSAGFTRYEKVCALTEWPEALENLRVCIRGAEREKNCCRCHKCVRVMLYFRFAGAGLPPAFERDVSDFQILRTSFPSAGLIRVFKEVLANAQATRAPATTILALRGSIFLNRVRLLARRSKLLRRARRLGWKQSAASSY